MVGERRLVRGERSDKVGDADCGDGVRICHELRRGKWRVRNLISELKVEATKGLEYGHQLFKTFVAEVFEGKISKGFHNAELLSFCKKISCLFLSSLWSSRA